MDYGKLLFALLPDLLVVVAVFAALGVDYGVMRGRDATARGRVAAAIAAAGLFAGFALASLQALSTGFWDLGAEGQLVLGEGQIVLTPLRLGFKAFIFLLAMAVVQFSAPRPAAGDHVSDYFALVLLATLGMGFVVTGNNLLIIFISLELISLSFYALVGFNHPRSAASAEAAIKYFAFGGTSSACLLFGFSYLYGATGEIDVKAVASALAQLEEASPLPLLATVFILVGVGFKIAAVPFHLWAPDVYQCAPTPVAAWVATGSKVASFFVLAVLLQPVLASPGLGPATVVGAGAVALASMLLGNLGALRQSDLKRLLAYSSIAHAGYLLVGLAGASVQAVSSVLFYALAYAPPTLGAFAVLAVLENALGRNVRLRDLDGAWKTHPGLALLLALFVLSLAGIPPLAGFISKYYLFVGSIAGGGEIGTGAAGSGNYWLVAAALVLSTVALYYYLMVVKALLIQAPAAEGEKPHLPPVGLDAGRRLWLLALGVVTVLLGVVPGPVIEFVRVSVAIGYGAP